MKRILANAAGFVVICLAWLLISARDMASWLHLQIAWGGDAAARDKQRWRDR